MLKSCRSIKNEFRGMEDGKNVIPVQLQPVVFITQEFYWDPWSTDFEKRFFLFPGSWVEFSEGSNGMRQTT